MAVRPIDPQIANRVRARNRAAMRNDTYTLPNLEGRVGASGATPTSRDLPSNLASGYDVDAGERDAPKFAPLFTGRGQNAYENFGSLEGLTGRLGPALGKGSREAEAAARAKFIAGRNALGNPDRFAGGQLEGGLGLVGNTARDIANRNRARNVIRDVYGLKGDIGNVYELADAGSLGVMPLGNETGAFIPTPLNEADIQLDNIEKDLMSGGVQFGDLRTLQAALVKMRGSLNANQLQRSRRLEDYALALDKYRRQADRLRRGIPGSFNQRGMLNSGQFDRGMGEFEGQVIRDELDQKHKLQRVLQDLNFADRGAGYEFDETIRENAIEGALASAAKAANVTVPGLEGGYNPVGRNVLNESGQNWMDAVIQSIVKRT